MGLKKFAKGTKKSAMGRLGHAIMHPTQTIGNAWGDITGKNREISVAKRNAQLSERKFEYDKQLQQEIFHREDTAHQRAVTDLTAAGLSPVLAAGGGGASAGPVVHTEAPREEPLAGPNIADAAMLAMNLMSAKSQISKANSEMDLIESQKRKTDIQSLKEKHDYNIMKRTGMPSHPSWVGSTARDLALPFMGLFDHIKHWYQGMDKQLPDKNSFEDYDKKVQKRFHKKK